MTAAPRIRKAAITSWEAGNRCNRTNGRLQWRFYVSTLAGRDAGERCSLAGERAVPAPSPFRARSSSFRPHQPHSEAKHRHSERSEESLAPAGVARVPANRSRPYHGSVRSSFVTDCSAARAIAGACERPVLAKRNSHDNA
jgi:hypothetical protein